MVVTIIISGLGYQEGGRLELQLIGGVSDSHNYSEELFYNILRKYYFGATVLENITSIILSCPADNGTHVGKMTQ